jgi:hypothetical protein
MAEQRSCGHLGRLAQSTAPVWEPLVAAIGQRLAETFMWMHEEELVGEREPAPCGGFVPMRLDHAIEQALCGWWILSGWDAQDAEAVRDAVLRACDQLSGGA